MFPSSCSITCHRYSVTTTWFYVLWVFGVDRHLRLQQNTNIKTTDLTIDIYVDLNELNNRDIRYDRKKIIDTQRSVTVLIIIRLMYLKEIIWNELGKKIIYQQYEKLRKIMKIMFFNHCMEFIFLLVMECITLFSTILPLIIFNFPFVFKIPFCWNLWMNFIIKTCRHTFQQTRAISWKLKFEYYERQYCWWLCYTHIVSLEKWLSTKVITMYRFW